MYAYTDKSKENKCKSAAYEVSHKHSVGASTLQFIDNRPLVIAQRRLNEVVNNNQHEEHASPLQVMANKRPQSNKSLQSPAITKKENNTDRPDNLKTGVEYLLGECTPAVKGYKGLYRPVQLKPLVYTHGTDNHIGSVPEAHAPHDTRTLVNHKDGGRANLNIQLKIEENYHNVIGPNNGIDAMDTSTSWLMTSHSEKARGKTLQDTIGARNSIQLMRGGERRQSIKYKVIGFGTKDPERINKRIDKSNIAHVGIYIPKEGIFFETGAMTKNCSLNEELTQVAGFEVWSYALEAWLGDTIIEGTANVTLNDLRRFTQKWRGWSDEEIKRGKTQFPNNCRGYVDAALQFCQDSK